MNRCASVLSDSGANTRDCPSRQKLNHPPRRYIVQAHINRKRRVVIVGVQLGLKLAAGAGRVVLDVEDVDILDRTLMIHVVQQTFDQTLNQNAL